MIGHSLFCLLFALVGGFLTRRFQEVREKEREEQAQTLPG